MPDPTNPSPLPPADRALLLGMIVQSLCEDPDDVLVMYFGSSGPEKYQLPPHLCARIAANYARYLADAERLGIASRGTLDHYRILSKRWSEAALRAA